MFARHESESRSALFLCRHQFGPARPLAIRAASCDEVRRAYFEFVTFEGVHYGPCVPMVWCERSATVNE